MAVSSFYWILGELENYFKWKLKKPKRLWMDEFEKKGSRWIALGVWSKCS
tara:strand:+ start:1085 stop:1234 length:150 start_codon:yes stop_codon:yes gene_type:complete